MTTTIPAITALPAVPNPNTPATFETLGYPFTLAQANMAVELEATRVAMNTVGGEVTTLANTATTQATAAAAANVAAAVNAAAAAASAGAVVWVTGTTYAAGVVRYSPTNYQTYRDTAGGLSSTDPASDTTGRWISAMLPQAELPNLPPTAVFNFASGVIDRRFVESRSTDGTRYNIFGNLETLSAGVAKPTFDPATKEAKGYLAEPAATYLDMRSTEMDNASYWTSTNATPTPASSVGIDGALSMFKVEADSTAATNCYRVFIATATAQYFAVRVKKGSGATDANLFVVFNNTTAATLAQLTINYDTGAVSQTIGSGATAEDVGHGGVWEIRIPVTSGIGVGNTVSFYTGFADAVETAAEYAYISHVDVADKPNLTHIPTAGSNITTVGGGLTIDLATHDDLINPEGFTVVLAIDATKLATSQKILMSIDSGSGNEIYLDAVSGNWGLTVAVGSSLQFSTAIGPIAAGRNVLAFSVRAGACIGVVRGSAVAALGSMAAMPALTGWTVGGYMSPGLEPSVPIEHVIPFPRACTAGELRAFVNNF